jgi:hypothetical protein
MSNSDSKNFQFRGFVSLLLSFAFLIVVVTGLVLWLSHSPQTFGLGKGAWKHTHIFTSLLLLVAGVLHLILNWRAYCNYWWQRTAWRFQQKRELALALGITLLIVVPGLFLQHGGPGDMQRLAGMSLQQIAERNGTPVSTLVASLKTNGIEVHDPADSLAEIAKHNDKATNSVVAAVNRSLPANALQTPQRGHRGE